MIIFTIFIVLFAIIGICCAFSNRDDIESSNILLAILSSMVLFFGISNSLEESKSSIVNTYCTKYYGNNVVLYNKCKYNNKENFSKVIKKGIK